MAKLLEQDAVVALEDGRVGLASGQAARVRRAVKAADRVRASPPLGPADAASNVTALPGAEVSPAPGWRQGDVIVEVQVAPDLMQVFARALERAAVARSTLWGVDSSEGFLLVSDDMQGDAMVLAEELRAQGLTCRRIRVGDVMSSAELVGLARRLQNASPGGG